MYYIGDLSSSKIITKFDLSYVIIENNILQEENDRLDVIWLYEWV